VTAHGVGNAVEAGWTAAQTAIVAVAVIALVGAVISASITYWFNQRAARRERRSTVFAEALSTVEEYAEMPYRIRRRLNTAQARYDLCEEVSRLQSRLAFYQTLLQIESPGIAVAYSNLVRAAKIQAGGQMQDAWRQPVLITDAEMNLGARYSRDQIDAARTNCVVAMQRALGRRHRAVALPLSANSDPPAD
jgi:hypothetical protein